MTREQKPKRITTNKSAATIKRELDRLRKLIEDPSTPPITKRVAWAQEQAIRWAIERTRGWTSPSEQSVVIEKLIRNYLFGNIRK